jgi:hypothetical protein
MQLVSGRDEFQPAPALFNATRLYQRRVQAKLFFFFHLIISYNISNGNSIRAKTRELKHKHATRLYKRRVPRSTFTRAQDAYCQLSASSGCHETGRKLPRGSFCEELVSRRDEFHVELVSKRDEAVFLNTSPTVFFREFLVQNGLSCVFPRQ